MKKFLLLLISSLTAISFAGCGKEVSDEESTTKITMAVNPFIGAAPIYAAIDKGFFKENGIDFNLVNFDDSGASCTALLSDQVDVAYCTLDSAIISESQSEDNKIKITSVVDESDGADGILIKNDINSLADLKGKTVGVSINQTSHYLLLKALESAGLSDSDVNLVNMSSSDAGVSFISGNLDAAVTWEPYLSNAVNEGAGKMIFSSSDAPGSIVDVLAVRSENIDAEWLEAFNRAYNEGLAFANDNNTHKEAMDITAKYLDVSSDEADSMYKTVKLYSTDNYNDLAKEGGILNYGVSDISKFYLDKKIITRDVTPSEILK